VVDVVDRNNATSFNQGRAPDPFRYHALAMMPGNLPKLQEHTIDFELRTAESSKEQKAYQSREVLGDPHRY